MFAETALSRSKGKLSCSYTVQSETGRLMFRPQCLNFSIVQKLVQSRSLLRHSD